VLGKFRGKNLFRYQLLLIGVSRVHKSYGAPLNDKRCGHSEEIKFRITKM